MRTKIIIGLIIVLPLIVVAYRNCEKDLAYFRISSYEVESGVKSELRYLGQALESYYEDQNAYPPSPPDNGIPFQLTTPMVYKASTYSLDLIARRDKSSIPFLGCRQYSYRYYLSSTTDDYILVSNGRDLDMDIIGYPENEGSRKEVIFDLQYDPTNGGVSDGDIFLFGSEMRELIRR